MGTNQSIYEEYKAMYHHLAEAFGIYSQSWSEIHENYSPSMFCEANRLSIIGEYLIWKDFVNHAKRFGVVYYQGIDVFLEEYKNAVECRVNLK